MLPDVLWLDNKGKEGISPRWLIHFQKKVVHADLHRPLDFTYSLS